MSLLSPDDRSFVLRTAIAGELNGDLADALTDRADGHRRLSELARAGVLLAPLDSRGEWYRYHALFRELLYAELRSDLPEQVPELHRRTAWWLAQHGDDARALLHAVEAGAWDLAARLAGERWVDLLIRGDVSALRPLIERLPPEWIERDPELALAIASALLDRGDHAGAARLLRSAEAAAERVPEDREARFAVSFAALSLHVARLRGDLSGALETGRALARDGRLEPGVVDARPAGAGAREPRDRRAVDRRGGLRRAAPRARPRRGGRGRPRLAGPGRGCAPGAAHRHAARLPPLGPACRRGDRARRAARLGADVGGGSRVSPARDGARSCGTGATTAARSVELARDALHGTQERPLRACLALLRSGVLARAGDVEAALAVLEAGAEELGDWPLLEPIRNQFGAHEAMLRAELGDRAGALRALGNGSSGAASLAGAVVLAKLQLGDGDWRSRPRDRRGVVGGA